MKTVKLILSGVLFFSMLTIGAQSYFEMVLDYNNSDFVSDIDKLSEDGFLIFCRTRNDISGIQNNIIIKLDNNGDTIGSEFIPFYGYSIVEFDSCFY